MTVEQVAAAVELHRLRALGHRRGARPERRGRRGHTVLRTDLVDALERAGAVTGLVRAARNAARFRHVSGMTWRRMLRDGLAMRRAGLGVLASGQVVAVIDDLPACRELIEGRRRRGGRRLADGRGAGRREPRRPLPWERRRRRPRRRMTDALEAGRARTGADRPREPGGPSMATGRFCPGNRANRWRNAADRLRQPGGPVAVAPRYPAIERSCTFLYAERAHRMIST